MTKKYFGKQHKSCTWSLGVNKKILYVVKSSVTLKLQNQNESVVAGNCVLRDIQECKPHYAPVEENSNNSNVGNMIRCMNMNISFRSCAYPETQMGKPWSKEEIRTNGRRCRFTFQKINCEHVFDCAQSLH